MIRKLIFISICLFHITCKNDTIIDVCECTQFLINNFHEDQVWLQEKNQKIKKCQLLSIKIEFIEKMKNCENYKQFIKKEVEKTYQNLINPTLEKDVTIQNITK